MSEVYVFTYNHLNQVKFPSIACAEPVELREELVPKLRDLGMGVFDLEKKR